MYLSILSQQKYVFFCLIQTQLIISFVGGKYPFESFVDKAFPKLNWSFYRANVPTTHYFLYCWNDEKITKFS